ncbi:MAG: VWA domain-containing protein [Spirochaetales bacterium]|nr:VWA domain-containing protein [Spirochaetales bacterium]
MRKRLWCLLVVIVAAVPVFADSVSITQIDNSQLIANNRVKAYVSVTDNNGYPIKDLTKDDFRLFEGGKERAILDFRKGVNINEGVNLLLIIDNSGSMYEDASGNETENRNQWRITYAKNAVASLLKQIKNPQDRVGFATFNVRLHNVINPTANKVKIEKALGDITVPTGDERYTELYESLHESIRFFQTVGGRKVIILLSDGENYQLKDNPNYPERAGLEGAIEAAQKEGISVFTIGLIHTANRDLTHIAENTGGRYFPAYKPEELENLYSLIRNQILNEYLMIYEAGMIPADKKLVKVEYERGGRKSEGERYYFSETIFGKPQERLDYFMFLAVLAAFLLLFIFSLMKFKNRKKKPNLEVLTTKGSKTLPQKLTIAQDQKEITIGTGMEDDITLAMDDKAALTEVTIKNDHGIFTLASDDIPVTVNNKKVKKKVLRSGDLIKVGETTIVFDGGVLEAQKKKQQKKKKKK